MHRRLLAWMIRWCCVVDYVRIASRRHRRVIVVVFGSPNSAMLWLLVFVPAAAALNYRCQNDQVLVVQSFGNDTIRMHCQRLDICGYQQLRCDYDELQPQCGGLMNFVAHVVQSSSTSPVEHTCCNLFNPRPPHTIPTHVGNDCFIYELPDGSTHPKQPDSRSDDAPYTILKSAAEIPEHIDGMSGYRLRLYLLKNKAPPTLLVKGIERRLDGYRVTICRPRCTSYESVQNEEKPPEWKAISWSSWTSSTWSTWARSVWGNVADGQRRQRIQEVDVPAGSIASVQAQVPNGGPQEIHVHVNTSGSNNNVVNGVGSAPSQPSHINITVHTGQYKESISGVPDEKGEFHFNTQNFHGGPGDTGDGNGTDDGTGKGKRGQGKGQGDGDGSGNAGNGGKDQRSQLRQGEGDPSDGENGGGEGKGKGQGGSRGKNNKDGRHGAGGDGGDGDDSDLSRPSAEGGNSGDGNGGAGGVGKGKGKPHHGGDKGGKGGGKNGSDRGGDGGAGDVDGGDGGQSGGAGGKGGDGDGASGNGKGKTGKHGDGGAGKNGEKKGAGKDGARSGIGSGDEHASGGSGKNGANGKGGDGPESGTDGEPHGGEGEGANSQRPAKEGKSGKADKGAGAGSGGDGAGDGHGKGKGPGGDGGTAGGPEGGNGAGGKGGAAGDNGTGAKAGGPGDKEGTAGGKQPAGAGGKSGKNGKSGSNGQEPGAGDGDAGDGGAGGKRGGAGKGAGGDKDGGAAGKDGGAGKSGKAGGDGGPTSSGEGSKTGEDGADKGGRAGKGTGGPKNGPDGADGGAGGDGADGLKAIRGGSDRSPKGGGKGGSGADGSNGGDANGGGDGDDVGGKDGKAGKDGHEGAGGKSQSRQAVTDDPTTVDGGTTKRTIHVSGGSTTSDADGGSTTDDGDVFVTDRFTGSTDFGAESSTAESIGAGLSKIGAPPPGAAGDTAAAAHHHHESSTNAPVTDSGNVTGTGSTGTTTPRTRTSNATKVAGGSKRPTPRPAPAVVAQPRQATPRPAPPRAAAAPTAAAKRTPSQRVADAQADPQATNKAIDRLKKMNCFPADSLVTTVTGQKRMDQLAVGDFVLVPSAGDVLKYERVEMFYHREPETRAQFVVLFTESKKRLALTPLHLLPFGECAEMKRDLAEADGVDKWIRASRYADKATVGECVMTVTNEGKVVAERIVRVGRQVSEGIFSPMTADGALVVDGILSSCFSQVESHTVQKIVYDFLVYAHEFFGLSPGRNAARQGIPSFINYVHELSHVFLPFSKF